MAVVKHISGSSGGFLVGNSHSNGGIKAINKAIGKPLEMEGGEVVITKPAVDDNKLHEFNGEMLTNRQILSKINESGGGVSFAELGAELPTEMHCSGTEYKFGGETLSDYEITHRISKCGCQHDDKLEEGGFLPNDIPKGRLDDISLLIDLQKKREKKLPTQYDINLIKNAFYNKVKKLPIVEATVILDYLTDLEKTAEVKPIFSKNHKIWENYIPQTEITNSDRKPLYQEGSYVKYSTGDIDVEKWVGVITEINDFKTTFGYRINAYNSDIQNPMHDSEHTNEIYESSLKPALKSEFDKAKQAYEKYKNLHHATSPITELYISSENPLSSQLTRLTGDSYNTIDFENVDEPGQLNSDKPFYHKKSGKKFVVIPKPEYLMTEAEYLQNAKIHDSYPKKDELWERNTISKYKQIVKDALMPESSSWKANEAKESKYAAAIELGKITKSEVEEIVKYIKPYFNSLGIAYEKYLQELPDSSPIIELENGDKNHVSSQLFEHTGEDFISGTFNNIIGSTNSLDTGKPFFHEKTGKKFIVVNKLPSTEISAYSNPYEINRAIEKFLDDTDDDFELTPDQKEFISHYSGYGGLEKFGSFSDNELKGLLYEYFTPDEIVKKMWALAYKYGFGVIQNPYILEPSVGTGNFLKYAPVECMIFGNEINKYSKRICEILYPKAQIALQPFERNFIEKNLSIKGKIDKLQKYDLVIGNPPYGQANSKYMSMGEDNYTKARNFTEYFISRGLDLCKSGGLLIYVVGAEQYNGGTLFLDGGISEVKKLIAQKAQLLDAYRLPTKIFERTGVASEILVFKKN